MEDMAIELTPQLMVLVPIVAAIVQILKRVEPVQKVKQYLPFIAIGLALGLAYLMNVPKPILPAIVIGLMASGAYDALKAPKTKAK